jgi:CRP-like cAMP-binding protein
MLMLVGQDPAPQTVSEKFMVTFFITCGGAPLPISASAHPPPLPAGIGAYVFGAAALLVANLNSLESAFQVKLGQIQERMMAMGIPHSIQKRVREFYDFRWSRTKGVEDENYLKELSLSLHGDILFCIYKDMLRKVKEFKDVDVRFLTEMLRRMERRFYEPTETVIEEGRIGREMFFVIRGTCICRRKDEHDKIVATFTEGGSFGELALFHESERRSATITAKTFCELMVLHKDDFDEILKEFPHMSDVVIKAARLRLQEIRERQKMQAQQQVAAAALPVAIQGRRSSVATTAQTPVKGGEKGDTIEGSLRLKGALADFETPSVRAINEGQRASQVVGNALGTLQEGVSEEDDHALAPESYAAFNMPDGDSDKGAPSALRS